MENGEVRLGCNKSTNAVSICFTEIILDGKEYVALIDTSISDFTIKHSAAMASNHSIDRKETIYAVLKTP